MTYDGSNQMTEKRSCENAVSFFWHGQAGIDVNSNEFIFDIPISEKDLLELLPQKVYNMAG